MSAAGLLCLVLLGIGGCLGIFYVLLAQSAVFPELYSAIFAVLIVFRALTW